MSWTTPESLTETLPLKGPAGIVITADARIDNRDALLTELGSDSFALATQNDSALILHAYAKWGEDCVQRLVGDFVFAIWDPIQRKIFCARDSMGIKHFYYYYVPGTVFIIASEPKALLRCDGVVSSLNESHIGDLLVLNHNDKENTPFVGIKRLPANTAMVVDPTRLKTWKYWSPSPADLQQLKTNRDYEERFRDLFVDAVKARMRSPFPTGSMLSGGLDSSSISCVASAFLEAENKAPLETFSAVFPDISKTDARIDERPFMDSVIQRIRCHPNFVVADSFGPLRQVETLQWHADHPVGVPNVFMDWAIFAAAGQRKVRLLQSGFDGDSTVSYGYEALPVLAKRGHWFRVVRDSIGLKRNMPHPSHTLKRLVWKQAFRPAVPESVRKFRQFVSGRENGERSTKPELPKVMELAFGAMDPEFARAQHLQSRYFDLIETNHPSGVDDLTDTWNGLSNGLFAFALETFEKIAAAFRVEPRFPFFDRRLIEFCASLPAKQKLYRGWTRSIFRRSMEGVLPADVQWRHDKANIGLSFKLNLLKYDSLEIDEALSDSTGNLRKYFNMERLKAAYSRYKADPLGSDREAMLLMSAVYMSKWLRAPFAE